MELSLCVRKPTIGVRPGPTQTGLYSHRRWLEAEKFWIWKVEKMYYLCSENKGADQLRSYCEADLHLCFRLCRLLVAAAQLEAAENDKMARLAGNKFKFEFQNLVPFYREGCIVCRSILCMGYCNL